jgi:serine/threonine protein kinase
MSFDAHQLHRPGTVVAGYTVLDVLGSSHPGTMVYRGKKTARPARLKVITTDDAGFRQRCTEAWNPFRKLKHANVLTAREMVADRQLAFATDYVASISLARYLARGGRCPRQLVLHIVASIASALDAGASEGLLHLNLKPTNVLLAETSGRPPYVYVTDFGMARQSWKHVALEIGDVPPADLLFVPPECFVASPHKRSDIYSLGMIAYVLLGGPDVAAVPDAGLMLWAHANETTPPIPNFNRFTDGVAHILTVATARTPDERPASGLEFSQLLARALHVVRDDHVVIAIDVPDGPTGQAAPAVVSTGERDTSHEPRDRLISVVEIIAIIIIAALVSCACTVILLKASGLA